MKKNQFWRGSIFFRFFHSDRPICHIYIYIYSTYATNSININATGCRQTQYVAIYCVNLWPYVCLDMTLFILHTGTQKHYGATNGSTERIAPMTILFHYFDCCWLFWWQLDQVPQLTWGLGNLTSIFLLFGFQPAGENRGFRLWPISHNSPPQA